MGSGKREITLVLLNLGYHSLRDNISRPFDFIIFRARLRGADIRGLTAVCIVISMTVGFWGCREIPDKTDVDALDIESATGLLYTDGLCLIRVSILEKTFSAFILKPFLFLLDRTEPCRMTRATLSLRGISFPCDPEEMTVSGSLQQAW